MNIVIVFDDLSGGGAARVATLLGSAWVKKGWAVCMLTTDDGSMLSVYDKHENILHKPLSLRGAPKGTLAAISQNLRRLVVIRKALKGCAPDVIISFLDTTNVKTILATRGLHIPVIVTEHTDPGGWNIGRAWELLRRLTYPWADAVVCLGTRPLNYFGPRIRRRGVIIPNPVVLPDTVFPHAASKITQEIHTLVSLGSLRPVKGFNVLLDAFERVSSRHKNWQLKIWGDGPLRKDLEAHAQRLGAADRIELPGITQEPYLRLSESDVFVLPSRVEGFPMALCEAMAVGLPVIATDVGAVSDIIRNDIDGILVPLDNIDALAEAMDRLMGSHELRCRLADRALEVVERFSIEKVMGMWEKLIRKVTGKDICEPAKD